MENKNNEEVFFLDILKEEIDKLEQMDIESSCIEEDEDFDEDDLDFILEMDESELEELREELGYSDEDMEELISEATRRRVSAKGEVRRVATRRTQRMRANRTSNMSPSQRRRAARGATLTRKRNPAAVRKAVRKRRRAMRRRRQMGIRN